MFRGNNQGTITEGGWIATCAGGNDARSVLPRRLSDRERFAVALVAAAAVLALTAGAAAAATPLCTNTAIAAFKAGRAEVVDDLWIGLGNCSNLRRGADRKECREVARDEALEGRQLVAEQLEARKEVCELLGESAYDPIIVPSRFVEDPLEIGDQIEPNPYFPLVPGSTFIYENEDEIDTVIVTSETKEIQGVTTIVVSDVVRLKEDDSVIEDTEDYYAQDKAGNVWYFGEIAKNFEDGELVDIEGSWKAGRDSAKAGVLMLASPMVDDVYRQEFSLGDAEDLAQVLSLAGSETVPAASCGGASPPCLITEDFSPIEPDVSENKYYAPGLGLILEVDPETGDRNELVDFSTP